MASSAQSSSVSFAYPPKSTPGSSLELTLNVLDSVAVSWKSNYDQAWLWLWCNTSTTGGMEQVYGDGAPTSGTLIFPFKAQSQISSRKNWSAPVTCHFDLNYQNTNGKGISGPGVTVTSIANKVEATTYSLGATSVASSTLTRRSSSITSSPTLKPTAGAKPSKTSSPDQSNSLSDGAIAGIVIGVVLGVAVIMGLGFMLYHNRRKMKGIEAKLSGQPVEVSGRELYEAPTPKYAQNSPHVPPQELESYNPPHELPGSPVTRPPRPVENLEKEN